MMRRPVLVCAVPLRKPSFYYLPTSCEAVELRLDYMENLALTQEVKRVIEDYVAHYPTIVTVRERGEGGGRSADPEVKYGILEFSKGVGAIPDVEVDLLTKHPELYGDLAEGSILSRHVFARDVNAHELAVKDLDIAKRFGALIYKVFSANDKDFLNLLSLLGVNDVRVAVIPRNPAYRAVAMMMGSALMYCSVRGKTGPGQLSIGLCSKVKALMNSLLTLTREGD